MARFYNTSQAQIMQGGIYTPPWELMSALIEKKDEEIQGLFQESSLTGAKTDTIKHLNWDFENERVAGIQAKYNNRIEDLTEKIRQDPLKYQTHLGELRQIQRDMMQDMTTGEWSKIEGRYQAVQDWISNDNNKQVKKSDPITYSMLLNHFTEDLKKRAKDDPLASFEGSDAIARPDMIQDLQKIFKDIKESKNTYVNGDFIVSTKGISDQEVLKIASQVLASRPEYAAYMRQMGNTLGLEGYINKDGTFPTLTQLQDPEGNIIDGDALDELSKEDRAKIALRANPKNPFYNDISAIANIYSGTETDIKENQFSLNRQNHVFRTQEASVKFQRDLMLKKAEWDRADQKERQKIFNAGTVNDPDFMNKLRLKAIEDPESGAAKLLDRMTAQFDISTFEMPSEVSFGTPDGDGDRSKLRKNMTKYSNGNTPIRGDEDFPAYSRYMNATNKAKIEIGRDLAFKGITTFPVKAENNKTYQIPYQAYFNYLQNNYLSHNRATLSQFLNSKDFRDTYLEGSNIGEGPSRVYNPVTGVAVKTPSKISYTIDNLNTTMKKYETIAADYYKNVNNDKGRKVLGSAVINPDVEITARNFIRDNIGDIEIYDESGKRINFGDDVSNRKVDAILDANNTLAVFPANSYKKVGMFTSNEAGKRFYIFPKTTGAGNIMMQIGRRGTDPQSQFNVDAMNDRINEFNHLILSADPAKDVYGGNSDLNNKVTTTMRLGDPKDDKYSESYLIVADTKTGTVKALKPGSYPGEPNFFNTGKDFPSVLEFYQWVDKTEKDLSDKKKKDEGK